MEVLGVIDFNVYLLGVLVIVLLPGPNSMYVLLVSTQTGHKQGWFAALGVFLGDSILMAATALGVGNLLSAYPTVFDGLKYIGSAYLAYLGMLLVWNAYQTYKNKLLVNDDKKINTNRSAFSRFKKALLLSLLNPKAIFFFLAFFVQFVDPNYNSPIISFLVLAFTLQMASFCYLALLIYFGIRFSYVFRQNKWLNISLLFLVGLIFLGFSAHLLLTN